MNDTGGGVTAIHDVPGDITRIGFHWMLLFFLSVTRRVVLLFVLHTECLGGHGVSLSRICELSNCFLHTENRGDHGFSCPDFFLCPEFSNFRIFSSRGESRRLRIFFVPIFFLVPNLRIVSFTRNVAESFFFSRIIVLSFFFHTENRGDHGFSLSRDLSLDPLTTGR